MEAHGSTVSARSTGDEFEVLFRAVGLGKAFGETQALRDCSVELRAGEVHAVVGENGSGKSTFVKILSGVLAPDSGSLELGGEELHRLRSPGEARKRGIATVFQEVLVVDALSVLDNIWLGADGELRRRVAADEKRLGASEALALLSDSPPPLDRPLEELDLSLRQVTVIARAVVQQPRIWVLDESTSALDVSARDHLFALVRRACADGTAVVFISHRMDEIWQIADRVTVLRSGSTVATLERSQTTPGEVLRLMSSRELVDQTARRQQAARDEVILRMDDVLLAEGHETFDTEVRAGEILGVAGLEGHGQERFLRVLAGVDSPISGSIRRLRNGSSTPIESQAQASRLGIAYVPRDRKTEGVFEPLSIVDNFSLPTLARDTSGGFVRERARRRRLREYVDLLKIRYRSPRSRITTLSGGNQQKVIMARWLATKPEVLVLNDPTRGVDLATKQDLYGLLDTLAREGVAIVMLSTEVEEHVALMDRVLVFREGRVFAEIPSEKLTPDVLVAAFFGEHLTTEAPT